MNVIEVFFLDAGFSWTLSKITPYLLTFILGFILVLILRKKILKFGRILRMFFQIFTFSLFFLVYFSFYPIYEGDFTNYSTQIQQSKENNELEGKKLIVLSIPGCPYCYESIGKMKKLIERNPSVKIEFLVCSNDESTLDWYKEETGSIIGVHLAKTPQAMAELAKGSFPTFVLVNDDNSLTVWSNSSFGVLAMDEVEDAFIY